MQFLAPLASLLGFEVGELVQRIRKDAVALGVMALFALVGLAFLCVAALNAMTFWLGPIWGPLALAGVCLVVAGSILIVLKTASGIAAKRQSQRRHSAEKTALVTTAAMSAIPLLMNSRLLRKVGLPLGGVLAAAWLMSRDRRGSDSAED